MEVQGEDWLPYAISSGESFVPVTEMTPQWFSNLFDGDIKAELPLKAEVWTYVDLCFKCFFME